MAMQWHWLDLDSWTVRLPGKYSKNKKPRTLPLEGVLRDIIERRIEKRDISCPFVFHRNGRPIKAFIKAFKAAAKRVGLDGILPHDMRRSAIRNFRKAGISENEGMKLSGHETRSVYDRYDITDEADTREAIRRLRHTTGKSAREKLYR